MKKRLLTRNLLLASALVLTGCQVDTLFGPLTSGAERQPSVSQQGVGALSMGVRWPDVARYRSQAIPFRADEIVISLVRIDEAGQEQPVIDHTGAEVPPVTFSRSSSGMAMGTELKLKPQRDIRITAKAYAVDGESRDEVASAQRTADVIPGQRTHLDLDLAVPTELAPRLDPLANAAVKFEQPIPLTGANLGFDPKYEATARLVVEGHQPMHGFSVGRPSYEWKVVPTSNSEVTVTIPERINPYGYYYDIYEALGDYYRDKENTLKVYLYLLVDGVPTNRMEVFPPKTGDLGARIELMPGSHATASTGVPTTYSLDVRSKFDMPTAPGTKWVYVSTFDRGGPVETRTYTVVLRNGISYMDVEWTNSDGSTAQNSQPLESFQDYALFGFTALAGQGQLQRLGTDSQPVPGLEGNQDLAHYFTPASAGGRDLWYALGVGLVRIEERAAGWNSGGLATMARTTVLKQFTRGAE